MSFPGNRLLKAAGVAVAVLGIGALAVVATPLVHGQVVTRRAQNPEVSTQWRWIGGSQIGVAVRDADQADADRAKVAQPTGAVVDEVRRDSPAASAGLMAGDLITRFDGERVRSARHFERLVADTPEGREVEMTVVRGGQNVALKVAPEASPSALALDRSLRSLRSLGDLNIHVPDIDLPELRNFRHNFTMPDITMPDLEFDFHDLRDMPRLMTMRGRLGVSVQELGDQLGAYFGAADGVLVTSVDDDTPASAAGLRAGDVITAIDANPVRSAGELRQRLNQAEGEVTITIIRDRKEQTVKATIEGRDVSRVERPARRIIR